ncbi:hypothetical protein [Vibrio parahaemolyticus]|uniref:hypothetical protein n=1 Tax=Vibrio parahaemolyticus TaxID=670 RepID=UPI0004D5E909|nr:hypothetical protein [Vibrio parahaemolyticus]MCR9565400.1 hypothetical protein [Vibrio alginolyticus]EGR2779635.1 hypothetical protein [Vibrio parahaemolyticus]EJC6944225.1 hypothetical protein [Vibrio parahaemolyticus]MCQ9041091.1 hypothetical protein [Vibrio parahaemolyticus]OAR51658.1 hypothetical protein EM55_019845 [Vibrio parahaemolyticus]
MEFKYCFMIGGNSPQIKIAADVIEQSIEEDFDAVGGQFDTDSISQVPSLSIKKNQYRNSVDPAELIVGICLFFGTWISTKFLDELYEESVKSSFNRFINAFKQKMSSEKRIDLLACTYFGDIDLTIAIRLTSTLAVTTQERDSLFRLANQYAMDFVKENGKRASIHYYHIENGSLNIKPMLVDSIEQIHRKNKN